MQLYYIFLICSLSNYIFKNVCASNIIAKATINTETIHLDDTDPTKPILNSQQKQQVDQPNDAKTLFEDQNLVSYKIDHHNIQKALKKSNKKHFFNYIKTPNISSKASLILFNYANKYKRSKPTTLNKINQISRNDASKEKQKDFEAKISKYNENSESGAGDNYIITTYEMENQHQNASSGDKIKSNLTREQTNFISHSKTSDNGDKIETSNFIESVFGGSNQYNEQINDDQTNVKRSIKVERDVQLKESRNVDEFLNDEPIALPLQPIIRVPFDSDDVKILYAEPNSSIQLNCELDLDVVTSIWMKDGQIIQVADKVNKNSKNNRFLKELHNLSISNVTLEDDGYWQCEAENIQGYILNSRIIKLVVLNPPKQPYLIFDSHQIDARNLSISVKENSELNLTCVSENGNPKPILTWDLLLSPGADRQSQKGPSEGLGIEEIKNFSQTKQDYVINSGSLSVARIIVFRALHNARVLCVMEHPSLKMRQNASILLDVQYSPSFAITRTPVFGYPLKEGMSVSLKCDVDSNPSSNAIWQKDETDPPILQIGDGYLNFSEIKREHSGWYKCTARYLNSQFSSIGYYLSVRSDSVEATSDPVDQDLALKASSDTSTVSHPFKIGQMDVELGGSVNLQCPQDSLGCWSHLDPNTARLKGLGLGGLSTPTGQHLLKDVAYHDAGIYKCIGQSATNKKKLEILHTVSVGVKGSPIVFGRNITPTAFPGSPLHLSVEFCANPPAHAARWVHGDRVYTPGNQYGIDVLAYGFIDLPTPFCKEARLTYVHMHEKVPRTFYFIVSSPDGVAEAVIHVNFTVKNRHMNNSNTNNNLPYAVDEDEALMEPEEIQFPIFGSSANIITIIDHRYFIIFIRVFVGMILMKYF